MHKFNDWPVQHRNLLLIVLFLMIALAAIAYIRLYPRWVEYKDLSDEKTSIEEKLLKSGWPKDSERLKAKLKLFEKELHGSKKSKSSKGDKDETDAKTDAKEDNGLIDETKEVIRKATSMFNERAEKEYESIELFIQKASQTEYKNQYDELDSYLQGKNIYIDNTIFGMDESTADPLKYQMLLKLWTVKEIVECASLAKMIVVAIPSQSAHGKYTSMISVKPMQSYYINANDAEPYLLEFPVYLELRGTLENFSKFTDLLFSDERFLPLSKLELVAVPPSMRNPPKPDKEGNIYSKHIIARITCSSFFLPQTPPQKKNDSSKSIGAPSDRPVGI